MKSSRLFQSALLLSFLLSTGCTIYETCATRYRYSAIGGQSLTEACSRGVVFRSNVGNRRLAETNCTTNFILQDLRNACFHGVDLYEEGRQGPILRQGLDRPGETGNAQEGNGR